MFSDETYSVTDIHCHLLPEVDDGAPSYEVSSAVLRSAANRGVRNIVLTPHYSCRRGYTMPKGLITERFFAFRERVTHEQIPIRLYLGREIEYSQDVSDMLFMRNLLTLSGSNCVLIEFDPQSSAWDIRQGLRQVMSFSYRPILAHIERYPELVCRPEMIEQLREDDVLMQMNLCSLIGKQHRFCKSMLKHGVVDFISSDHHGAYPDEDSIAMSMKKLRSWTSKEYFRELTYGNAQKYQLIQGEQ